MPVMYNLAIRKCTSPPLEAPKLKIFKRKFTTLPGSNPRPAEPKADMLPSEPARRALYKESKINNFTNDILMFFVQALAIVFK